MESTIHRINEIYGAKKALFKELLNCLNLERDSLVDLNIDNLWAIVKEKQKIFEHLQATAEQLKNSPEGMDSGQEIPAEDNRLVMELHNEIESLRSEIMVRIRENVTFIEEVLDFFNEIISIFTSNQEFEDSYKPIGNGRKELSPKIYYREV